MIKERNKICSVCQKPVHYLTDAGNYIFYECSACDIIYRAGPESVKLERIYDESTEEDDVEL